MLLRLFYRRVTTVRAPHLRSGRATTFNLALAASARDMSSQRRRLAHRLGAAEPTGQHAACEHSKRLCLGVAARPLHLHLVRRRVLEEKRPVARTHRPRGALPCPRRTQDRTVGECGAVAGATLCGDPNDLAALVQLSYARTPPPCHKRAATPPPPKTGVQLTARETVASARAAAAAWRREKHGAEHREAPSVGRVRQHGAHPRAAGGCPADGAHVGPQRWQRCADLLLLRAGRQRARAERAGGDVEQEQPVPCDGAAATSVEQGGAGGAMAGGAALAHDCGRVCAVCDQPRGPGRRSPPLLARGSGGVAPVARAARRGLCRLARCCTSPSERRARCDAPARERRPE